jgi:hypothetical protein
MKKLIIPALIIFLLQVNTFSQSCLPEGITFTSQIEIDQFKINYPGCNIIEGNVNIWGNMTNLDSLYILTAIFGNVWISAPMLEDLSGLDNLSQVNGDFRISGNVLMIGLEGLEGLMNIGGELWIQSNFALENLYGLNHLNEIGGNLTIEDNDALSDLEGMEQLAYVGGQFSIWDNENINSLAGVGNLTAIGSALYISNNPLLVTLVGLTNLSEIGGDLWIDTNPSLINLTGLESLNSIAGWIRIKHNISLNSLTGIENLDGSSIQNIEIKLNNSLTSCAVESICEFLSNPTGVVDIYDNGEDCNNPPDIAHQCGFIMPCLPFGNYNFLYQSDIDSFQVNYPYCNKLEGEVLISGNDITDLNGLSTVDSIGFRLTIYNNGLLYNMAGLDGINFIRGALVILYNDQLNDISSLNEFNSDSLVVLEIAFNSSLSECNIESVCHYISNPVPGNNVTIHANAEGCATEDEVEAACGVGITEINQMHNIEVFPNPVRDIADFSLQIADFGKVTLKIYNICGQEIATVLDEDLSPGVHHVLWNVSSLPPGVYFYQQSEISNPKSETGKILIAR